MFILAIEATNPNVPTPGVLLARARGLPDPHPLTLATRGLDAPSRHDDVLLPRIAELFDEAGVGPGELDEVLVSIGPGGFTATRLACVSAAMLAEVSGATLRAIPTARIAVETTYQSCNIGGAVVIAMASKQDTAYVARFDPARGTFTHRGESIGPAAFETLLLPGDRLVFEDHLPETMLEIASKRHVECIPMRLTADGLLACRSAAETVPIEALRPIYPREPDAVTQWRRRYGRAPGDA
ncbi:MAG: tRNA threonylcarbamoyladenosine biosynthesis protein TsaB [Phycisphaerales bacterium JB060]